MRFSRLIARTLCIVFAGATAASAKPIVFDAEYYVLKSQHAAAWEAEDESLDAKLENLGAWYARVGARESASA